METPTTPQFTQLGWSKFPTLALHLPAKLEKAHDYHTCQTSLSSSIAFKLSTEPSPAK